MFTSSKNLAFLAGLVATALWPLSTVQQVQAFDYAITTGDETGLVMTDNSTGITDLITVFKDDLILVEMTGVAWEYTGSTSNDTIVKWTLLINGELADSGMVDIGDTGRQLPTSFDCGAFKTSKTGTNTIECVLTLDDSEAVTDVTFQVFAAGVSIVPLIWILFMAMTTHMVELSLFSGIWLGLCIVTGSLSDGFRSTINIALVDALADGGHVSVILFTVFLSGAVGMMQKSGGMLGFTRDIARVAKTPMTGQLACMFVGIIIFFDDYSSVLLAGQTMRPLLDLLSISREKMAFVVDATSAPIASISPISSWVGYEVGLIQAELDKIIAQEEAAGRALTITDSAFGIFLQSIKYRYYPIFMIILMFLLITSQRDFGPMLVAERRVRVYDRTDGGPNKGKSGEIDGDDQNQPREDQPLLSMNMLLPVMVLITLIFLALVRSGDDGSGTQSFLEKIEASDSYVALLYGCMGTAWIMLVLYLCQVTIPGTGKLVWPTPSVFMDMLPWRRARVMDEGREVPRFLMSVGESVESFLFGMTRIFLALIVLTLAWASGSMMSAIGADRLFASWIVNGIDYQLLPTLSFIVSLLIALATGTSWGTMAILFPLILVPTYNSSGGDPIIFYSTVAGVLSGSVAGDHMSPISDTTVLSSLACDVTLVAHVVTQAPYVLCMVLFSIIFGTLPIGYDAWPNMVGVALGWVCSGLFVYFICVPVISPTGRWDLFTKFCCGRGDQNLVLLAEDTIKKANGDTVELREDGASEMHIKSVEDKDADSGDSVDKEEVLEAAVNDTAEVKGDTGEVEA